MGTVTDRNKSLARLVYLCLKQNRGVPVKPSEEIYLTMALYCLEKVFPLKIRNQLDETGLPDDATPAPARTKGEVVRTRPAALDRPSVRSPGLAYHAPASTTINENGEMIKIDSDEIRKRNLAKWKGLIKSRGHQEIVPDEEEIRKTSTF